jgi:hypothetical protein
MEPVDVSIHGWPLGPVPLVASIYSAIVFISILSGKRKLNRDNTVSPIGVAALIVVLCAVLLGIHDRADLSRSIIVTAGVAGIILSIALSAMIHRKAGVPILHEWVRFESLPTKKILIAFLYMIPLILLFYGLDALFPDALRDPKCNTLKCRGAAMAFGSNLSAAGLLWLATWLFSLLGVVGALHAKELLLRIHSLIWGRTKGN